MSELDTICATIIILSLIFAGYRLVRAWLEMDG